jgi:hypothetical protein
LSGLIRHLPKGTQADLLVSPISTHRFGEGVGGAKASMSIVSRTGEGKNPTIVYNGQQLKGLSSSAKDRLESYEKRFAEDILAALEEAEFTGNPVLTSLALPTIEVLTGRKRFSDSLGSTISIANAIYPRHGAINEIIAQQGGDPLVMTGEPAGKHHSCSFVEKGVYTLTSDFENSGNLVGFENHDGRASAHPVAFLVHPLSL